MRAQLRDACPDEVPGVLRITVFMIARRHEIAFWEQSPARALACTPGHYNAYWWPCQNPSSSRNSAQHIPLVSSKSKAPFPQPFPLQRPQLPTKCPYPTSAAPEHLRAQIPQLSPNHSSRPPPLQLLAPKPLGHQHSHHISPITSPTKPSALQASSNPITLPITLHPKLAISQPPLLPPGSTHVCPLPNPPTNSLHHQVPRPGPPFPTFARLLQVFPPHRLPAMFSPRRESYLPPSLPLIFPMTLTAPTSQ